MRSLLILTGLALGGGQVAQADVLGTSRNQALREVAHTVTFSKQGYVGRFVVTREFHNLGREFEEARLVLDVPEGGSAIDLRINAKGVWHKAELLESDAAAQKYAELTGIGGATPQDPALLSWRSNGQLFLQVFPIPPGQTSKISYTFDVPGHFEDGEMAFYYPRQKTSHALRAPAIDWGGAVPTATSSSDSDQQEMEAWRVAFPVQAKAITARYDTLSLHEDTLQGVSLELPPRLSDVPSNLAVVFVVDASHSISEQGIATQLDLITAYLSHVVNAEVEIVVFRRYSQRLFGRFVKAAQVSALLAKLGTRFVPGNGSNLETGMALAAQALGERSKQTGSITPRIVAFTDELVSARVSQPSLQKSMRLAPAETILHFVPFRQRGLHPALVTTAARWGGIVSIWENPSSEWAVENTPIDELYQFMLELVRPTRLTAIEVEGIKRNGEEQEGDLPEQLAEGKSAMLFRFSKRAPRRLVMRGKLWSSPVTISFERTKWPQHELALRSLATGLLTSDEDTLLAARSAHAVSRMTSLLAIEPGVRPSFEGLPYEQVGVGGGVIGAGVGSGTGAIGLSGGVMPQPWLDKEILQIARKCKLNDWKKPAYTSSVDLQTTLDEIVDVSVKTTGPRAFSQCVTEAVWLLKFPFGRTEENKKYVVAVKS